MFCCDYAHADSTIVYMCTIDIHPRGWSRGRKVRALFIRILRPFPRKAPDSLQMECTSFWQVFKCYLNSGWKAATQAAWLWEMTKITEITVLWPSCGILINHSSLNWVCIVIGQVSRTPNITNWIVFARLRPFDGRQMTRHIKYQSPNSPQKRFIHCSCRFLYYFDLGPMGPNCSNVVGYKVIKYLVSNHNL